VTFLHTLKLRGAKPHDPVQVMLKDGALTITGTGAQADETLEGNARTIYMWMRQTGTSKTKAEIAKGTNIGDRSVSYALADLHKRGQIRVGHKGKYGLLYWSALMEADPPQDPEWTLEIPAQEAE
jgi:predicted DNA-binding transcriptional regulator